MFEKNAFGFDPFTVPDSTDSFINIFVIDSKNVEIDIPAKDKKTKISVPANTDLDLYDIAFRALLVLCEASESILPSDGFDTIYRSSGILEKTARLVSACTRMVSGSQFVNQKASVPDTEKPGLVRDVVDVFRQNSDAAAHLIRVLSTSCMMDASWFDWLNTEQAVNFEFMGRIFNRIACLFGGNLQLLIDGHIAASAFNFDAHEISDSVCMIDAANALSHYDGSYVGVFDRQSASGPVIRVDVM